MKLESFQHPMSPLEGFKRFRSSPRVGNDTGINRLLGFHVVKRQSAQIMESV